MEAEQRDDHMADESKGRTPGSSRRSRRETKTITQRKINQETKHAKWNGTIHIKITQNQYTDKVDDVTVVIKDPVPQIQNYAQKELEKETRQVDLGWTSDTVKVHVDAL